MFEIVSNQDEPSQRSKFAVALLSTMLENGADHREIVQLAGMSIAAADVLLASAESASPGEEKELVPALDPAASIQPDAIFSLIDGKPYKMLRRHLTRHGFTPESYRKAFGLPGDYPIIAPNYAETRRKLAIDSGLGKNPENKGAAR